MAGVVDPGTPVAVLAGSPVTAPAVLRPVFAGPGQHVPQEDIAAAMGERYGGLGHWPVARRVFTVAGIQHRWLLGGTEGTLKPGPLTQRNAAYMTVVTGLGTQAGHAALAGAGLEPGRVGALVFASCTGWGTPGPDAYIAGRLGVPPWCQRVPLSGSLGCAAGASALGRAWELAFTHEVVLVVCAELPSLHFQDWALTLEDMVSAAIFGDGVAACVVTTADTGLPGLGLDAYAQYTPPATEHVIRGTIGGDGMHFPTRRDVRATVRAALQGVATPDFVVSHTGGPVIMDSVRDGLGVPETLMAASRASFADGGNMSSVSVLDVLRRTFTGGTPRSGQRGAVLGIGSGVTLEMLAGTWHGPP
jgi:1,3,6,8-tetrahydroxynaphthalene synthase